jgi:hypothetical protein
MAESDRLDALLRLWPCAGAALHRCRDELKAAVEGAVDLLRILLFGQRRAARQIGD